MEKQKEKQFNHCFPKKNLLLFLIVFSFMFLFFQTNKTSAAEYTVSTSTSIVDGDTFCGGSACTSNDTIIIQAGERGSLELKSFNGNDRYINIVNQKSETDMPVTITKDSWYALRINNCKYIDVRGNNDDGIKYGFYIINAERSGQTVFIANDCDYLKLGYLKIEKGGVKVSQLVRNGDAPGTVYDTLEFHHMYMYQYEYSGFYLGIGDDYTAGLDPTLRNVSVHDNILEDAGAYGITLKRVDGGNPCRIYNNIVRKNIGVYSTGLLYTGNITGEFWGGLGVHQFTNGAYCLIYNNEVSDTRGNGIKTGNGNHLVYNNTLTNCGVPGGNNGNLDYSGGIMFRGSGSATGTTYYYNNKIYSPGLDGIHIISWAGPGYLEAYNNIIVNSARCGVGLESSTNSYTTLKNNTIVGSGTYGISGSVEGSEPYTANYNFLVANTSGGLQGSSITQTGNKTVTAAQGIATAKFTNANNKDYSLQAGSPAIDAGSAEGYSSADILGIPRPQPAGGKADAGAYEYTGGTSAPSTPAGLSVK